MSHKYTLRKYERLKSKKIFEQLAASDYKILRYPVLVKWTISDSNKTLVKVAFAVSKKRFPKAVKRNLVKRRLKEAYRLLKPGFYDKIPKKTALNLLIIYISNNVYSFQQIKKLLSYALNELSNNIKK